MPHFHEDHRMRATWGTTARLAAIGACVLAAACGGSDSVKTTDEAPGSTPGLTGAANGDSAAQGGGMAASQGGTMPAGTAGSGPGYTTDTTGSINTPGSGQIRSGDPSDASVAAVMSLIDRQELESSQLAVQRASNPEVKRYAQEMIAAHQGGGSQPANTRATGESDLTTFLQQAHTAAMNQLRTLPAGVEFDRAYMVSQVKAHEGAHQTLERLQTAARDNALTDRIRQKMAAVQQHLQRARAIQTSLGSRT
jgi:putative membrane protein